MMRVWTLPAVAAVIAFSWSGCRRLPAAEPVGARVEDEFHADDDIAMTLRSVMSSFTDGDTISRVDYSFMGVLTDGEGRPLYTDTSGGPGEWLVTVPSPYRLQIQNLHLGDLIPAHLERYLIENLDLSEGAGTEAGAADAGRTMEGAVKIAEEGERRIYRSGNAILEYYVRPAYTESGKEGPMVTVTVTRAAD